MFAAMRLVWNLQKAIPGDVSPIPYVYAYMYGQEYTRLDRDKDVDGNVSPDGAVLIFCTAD